MTGFKASSLILILSISCFAGGEHSIETGALVSEFQRLIDKNDFLGARILMRRLSTSALTSQDWITVRHLAHQDMKVGWDTLLDWDQRVPSGVKTRGHIWVEATMQKADKHLVKKQFDEAFRLYQEVAKWLKKASGNDKDNRLLYYTVLHSMARALYGAKRYSDALTIYSWMSPIYPLFHQTLVERTWTAFMLGDISTANGAIASQYSPYFEELVHPESLLVQIYIYRKLCRENDLKLALKKLQKYRENLVSGKVDAIQWAKSRLDTYRYVTLLERSGDSSSDYVSTADRLKERTELRARIENEFEVEKRQLLLNLGRAQAYATMLFSTTKKEFPPVRTLPSQEELLKSGLEMWPVEDGEAWLDELGDHIFIGTSSCQKIAP